MSDFSFLIKEIWKGESVTRSFLNLRLGKETLVGKVMDIGGGKNSDYISFMKRKEGVDFVNFDVKTGAQVDFEKDPLPLTSDSCDTVLFLNVMEHIFNHQHIASEVVRIMKPSGQLIGFVPFLMWYHADHRDFFRYTHEALEIIFTKAGANDIKIESVSFGPFIAAAQMVTASFPRLFRVPIFSFAYLLDSIFLTFRPTHGKRYALGYYFVLTK